MVKKISWKKPCKQLDGLTPNEWLAEHYADEPENKELARRFLALTGFDISLIAMHQRISRRASTLDLHKTKEAARESYERRGKHMKLPLRPALLRFDDWPTRDWKRFCATSDWHIPYWNEWLVRRMMLLCRHWNPPIKNLLVAGDLIDFEQLSKYIPERDGDGIGRTAEDDKQDTKEMLESLADWFDDILCLKGNHENRLHSRKLEQQFSWETLTAVVNPVPKKIKFSKWTWCIINDKWRATHPNRRWITPGGLSRRLAEKHQMNVILAHSHAMSETYSIGGHHIALDSGGMFQPELMGYAVVEDNPAPAWTPGFFIIDDDTVHGFNQRSTDWEFYRRALDIPLGWQEGR